MFDSLWWRRFLRSELTFNVDFLRTPFSNRKEKLSENDSSSKVTRTKQIWGRYRLSTLPVYTAHCTGQGAGADAAPVILFAPLLTGQARIDVQTVCLHRHRLGEEILIYRSGNIGNDSLVHYFEICVDFIVPEELAEDMAINAMNSAK